MGTFLGCVGTPHIPEERQKEFRGRMLRLLREGGMMNTEEVNLFGKKISLLHFPEPDEDGFFQVCYNYFENDCFAIHAKREVQDCKILQLVLQRQVVKLNIDINSRKLSL